MCLLLGQCSRAEFRLGSDTWPREAHLCPCTWMSLRAGVCRHRFYLLSVLLGELSWEVQPGDGGSAPSPAWCCAAPRRALRCSGCRLGCALQSGSVPESMCVVSVSFCWSDRELMFLTPFIPRAAAWAAHIGTLCAECRQSAFCMDVLEVSHVITLPVTLLSQKTSKSW